jgi:predicted unusual protein kinase regulating ubiquinone biosynthesis (AarF/ABC1/UbiB family)
LSKFEESNIPQSVRDEVGRLLMKLTFSEIFEMGIMQSDPNPSNFTYNLKESKLNLFDFGATHIYSK